VVGYRSDGRGFLLSEGLPVGARGENHYSREMMALGRAWLRRRGFRIPDDAVSSGPSLPACSALPATATDTGPAVWALACGATYGEAKSWPAEQVAGFLDLAVRAGGARVVLLGDPAASGLAAALAARVSLPWRQELPGPAGVVDLTGRTDLAQAVAVLKAARLFVGNDSGLMHLAAALQVPTVGIFGSSNPDWTGPRGRWTIAVAAEGFACRPCYRRRCNQPTFCLETVTARQVFEAGQNLLGRVVREVSS
jgi:heptosyltransferase-2